MKKQIVFFCATTPYIMIYKIAREFKKRGYETILITISQKDTWEEEWYKDGFDKMICSDFHLQKPTPKNSFNMLKRTPHLIKAICEMKKLNPYVVFGVARPNLITMWALKFFKKYPFIYFPYDITSHFYPDLETALEDGTKMYDVRAERYCFENADGIMHKGAPEELDHLNKENMLGENLNVTSLRINFLPYCSNKFIVPINKNKLSKKDGEVHLVYVGGLASGVEYIMFYKTFFEKLINQKIHIHIYSKTQHFSKEEDIEKLAPLVKIFSKNKYFHIEYAIDPKILIHEISKYDFGFWVDPQYKKNFSFTIGNKFASYLEAGLPFFYILNFCLMDNIMKKYGMPLSLDISNVNNLASLDNLNDFKGDIKKLNYKELEKNAVIARKELNMIKHFPRLEKFVEKVVREKFKRNENN